MLLTSGLTLAQPARAPDSGATRAANKLATLGVRAEVLIPCPAPFVKWYRTATSARGVRDQLMARGIKPRGINVVTAGPHARKTWVAYQHIMGDGLPVGIISVPTTAYNTATNAAPWWRTRDGLRWVAKDFFGWLKEALLGPRA